MIPDVAIGAVVAALIGAMISLVGLIVTKEAKVSEFRQAWIGELRGEFATFITQINHLEDASKIQFTSTQDAFEKTRDGLSKLNEAYFTIALRLNTDEQHAKNIQASMISLMVLVQDKKRDEDIFQQQKVKFIGFAGQLLKHEWVRVKVGEGAYIWTRRAAAATVVVLFLLVAVVATGRLDNKVSNVVDTATVNAQVDLENNSDWQAQFLNDLEM